MGRFEVYQVIQVGNPALFSSCGFNPLPIDDDTNRAVVDFRPSGIHFGDGGVRKYLIAAILLSVAGCSGCKLNPMIWPDYCKAQNRKILPEERYRDVLLHILSERLKYEKLLSEMSNNPSRFQYPRHKDPSVHFFAYYDRIVAKDRNISDQNIAAQYIKDYPECCWQGVPTYLRENWERDRYIDNQGLGWAVDVRIWRTLPSTSTPLSQESGAYSFFGRAVDGCNQDIKEGSAHGL